MTISRQRVNQLRHPERLHARQTVARAIKTGLLPKASSLICVDCGTGAQEYDHHLGYDPEFCLNVEPVCVTCHAIRTKITAGKRREADPMTNTLAERINRILAERGWSVELLAREAKCGSTQSMYRWRDGVVPTNPAIREKLAKALHRLERVTVTESDGEV